MVNEVVLVCRELAVHVDGFIAAVAHTTVVGCSKVRILKTLPNSISFILSLSLSLSLSPLG